jgi:hypothetical protein
MQSEELELPFLFDAFPGGHLLQSDLDDAPVADK